MELTYQCCFCGQQIKSIGFDVGGLFYTTNVDGPVDKQNSQQFWCHANCLKELLHPSVPLYIFDLGDNE